MVKDSVGALLSINRGVGVSVVKIVTGYSIQHRYRSNS